MPNLLPLEVDLGYCEQARCLSGQLALKSLPRLAELLHKSEGHVQVELAFAIDDSVGKRKIRYVKGTINAALELICQRCLQAMTWQVDKPFLLGLSRFNEELEQLPEHYDPYLAEDGVIVLSDLVEQELILSLPLIAKHKLEECSANEYVTKTDNPAQTDVQKPNPFAVLKDLDLKN